MHDADTVVVSTRDFTKPLMCHQCRELRTYFIIFTDNLSHEGSITICAECVRAASALLDQQDW